MNILEEIAEKTRLRIQKEQEQLPLFELRRQAEALIGKEKNKLSFSHALNRPGLSFICEIKKASPSKGVIAQEFPYISIAKEYEAAGASAVSCLTEPYWFQGSDRYLSEISDAISLPVLRKDFTISPYMVYQSKLLGASAILLICSILDMEELTDYLALAREMHLDILVETHNEIEIQNALKAGASIIGVNNRNLRTFEVDIENSIRLRALVPPNILFVSESGIQTPEDMTRLYENGTDAVLIGETLMRAADKKAMLKSLHPAKR